MKVDQHILDVMEIAAICTIAVKRPVEIHSAMVEGEFVDAITAVNEAMFGKRPSADWYGMVREFAQAFELGLSNAPTVMDVQERQFRANLLAEEVLEFEEAETLVDQVDAIIDLIYFALGILAGMGVDPIRPFALVHKANMDKLGPDGTAVYRDDGKLLKPDGWQGPEFALAAELAVQRACAEHGRQRDVLTPDNELAGVRGGRDALLEMLNEANQKLDEVTAERDALKVEVDVLGHAIRGSSKLTRHWRKQYSAAYGRLESIASLSQGNCPAEDALEFVEDLVRERDELRQAVEGEA